MPHSCFTFILALSHFTVRLPPSWTNEDIALHVDAVLDALSLAHVQHTRIGDEKTRGVSGGQRKRVNIGIEVSACPVALYLDEPTSGLDSTAALEVTNSLKHIAHSTGITVAMVIHQPRYEIWAALDEVLFLAPGGRTVYLGNLAAVQDYFFNQLGYMPTERDNPADFYMDRIAESGDVCVKAWADHVSSGHASRLSRVETWWTAPWNGAGGANGNTPRDDNRSSFSRAPLLRGSEDLDASDGGDFCRRPPMRAHNAVMGPHRWPATRGVVKTNLNQNQAFQRLY